MLNALHAAPVNAVRLHRACASSAVQTLPVKSSSGRTAVSSLVETPHTSLFHNAKEASPNQRFFRSILIYRSQTGLFILFTTCPTKRRKLTRNSRVGKILSTTQGRGNSSGALRAVGVSNRFGGVCVDKCQLHAFKTNVQTPKI